MNTLTITNSVQTHDDGRYFVVELAVDGSPVSDFTWYATDLAALKRSVTESGEHFILTCWCGFHECAGIYSGIVVSHKGRRTRWHVSEPEPTRDFEFDTDAYGYAIERAIAEASELLHRDPPVDKGTLHVVPDENAYFLGVYPWPDEHAKAEPSDEPNGAPRRRLS